MRRKDVLPELLAPAGDMNCLYAAVSAGADAIYVGGKAFGARAYAKNFDIDELKKAVTYCHVHGVKLYVTVNTLVYDREMRELSDYVARLYEIGVDAVITADLGVIREIRKRAPELKIHASTQMSVHNTDGAIAAAKLGAERVVLARELSLENINSVTEKCPIETEVFLHGALCVCHSGQCLFSSLVGGRSGNRGECAQPCRLPYNNGYPLSLSDLSLANHVKELVLSGVASLKIEGRMKAPEYVYTVTSIYRRLLDENRNANKSENARLKQAFSRGDFTDAYFRGDKTSKMTGVRSKSDKEATSRLGEMSFDMERAPVKAKVKIRLGERAEMTLSLPKKSVTVFGDVPTVAINQPLCEKDVKARLSKMGATVFSLSESDIELSLEGGINLSPASINALRRSAAEALENSERPSLNTVYTPEKVTRVAEKPLKTAQFMSKSAFVGAEAEIGEDTFDIIFLPITAFAGEANGVYIPPVVTDGETEYVEELLISAKTLGAKYALVSNIGHIAFAKRAGLVPVGDFRLNVTNSGTMAEYLEMGVERCVLSPEITLPMARDVGGGEIVYGRIPLMLTERCFIQENFGCDKRGAAYLSDRTGVRFPIICEFGHRNLVLNSRPTYMGDKKGELDGGRISHRHFIFTNESAREIASVVQSYKSSRPLKCEVRRIGKR